MLKILKTTTFAATAAFATTLAAQDGPYAPYAGTTLVVNFPAHPHYNATMEVLPEFTEQTGIEVEVDMLPYLDMRERQTLELALDEGAYDLISYVVFSKADYVYADQLENLAKYFMNPSLADPNYEASDLIDGYVQNIGVAGGERGYLPGPTGSLYGLPFGSETSVMYYRTDIFEEHGLEVPETYEQLLEQACLIPELDGRHGRRRIARGVGPPGQPRVPAAPRAAGRTGVRRQLAADASTTPRAWRRPTRSSRSSIAAPKDQSQLRPRRRRPTPLRRARPRCSSTPSPLPRPSRMKAAAPSPATSAGRRIPSGEVAASQTGGFGLRIPRKRRATRRRRSC